MVWDSWFYYSLYGVLGFAFFGERQNWCKRYSYVRRLWTQTTLPIAFRTWTPEIEEQPSSRYVFGLAILVATDRNACQRTQ